MSSYYTLCSVSQYVKVLSSRFRHVYTSSIGIFHHKIVTKNGWRRKRRQRRKRLKKIENPWLKNIIIKRYRIIRRKEPRATHGQDKELTKNKCNGNSRGIYANWAFNANIIPNWLRYFFLFHLFEIYTTDNGEKKW